MSKFIGFLALVLGLCLGTHGVAQAVAKDKVERVSGLYRLLRLEQKLDNEYILHFASEVKDGPQDLLMLKSEGMNVKIAEGQVVKLSAEVIKTQAGEREITQVLIFMPSQEYGLTPIWMLSKTYETREIRGARWLEMHAPQADFQIL